MMHTSPQVEDKIIYLAIRNASYAEIVRRLRKYDSVLIQRDTVSRIAKRFLNGEDFKCISGWPSVFNKDHLNFLDQQMEGDNELSTAELLESFSKEFGLALLKVLSLGRGETLVGLNQVHGTAS